MSKKYNRSTRVLYEGEQGIQIQADFIGDVEVNLLGNGSVMTIDDSRQRMIIPIARLIAIFMLAEE